MKRAIIIFAIAIAGWVRPSTAAAHPLDMGYLRIESRDPTTLVVTFDLESSVAARLVGTSAAALQQRLAEHADALAAATYRLAPIHTNAGRCEWRTTSAEQRPGTRTVSQTATARCPPGASTLQWGFPMFSTLPSTFELLAKSYAFESEHVTILRAGDPLVIDGATPHLGFGELVWSGVEHIGAAPGQWRDASGWKLADGIDHVLFVLALLLAGGTLAQLIGVATGFTIGHSITLALATLDIVRVPSSIVEPLVALTLTVAAIEAMRGSRPGSHRFQIALAFGCIHGFAFAGALGELGLASESLAVSLFAFNLGVELGQVAVIAIAAPALVALHRYRRRAGRIVVQVVGGAIAIAGLYWFVQRVFA